MVAYGLEEFFVCKRMFGDPKKCLEILRLLGSDENLLKLPQFASFCRNQLEHKNLW